MQAYDFNSIGGDAEMWVGGAWIPEGCKCTLSNVHNVEDTVVGVCGPYTVHRSNLAPE